MSTTILHADVQRSRFARHALGALAGLVPLAWRSMRSAVSPVRSLSASESAALEAQKVRDLAYSYSRTDPGFAADLYAAAARHEGIHAE
jgi:hypothetical protein